MSNQVLSSRQVFPNDPIKYKEVAFYVLQADQPITQFVPTPITFTEISNIINGLIYVGGGIWDVTQNMTLYVTKIALSLFK